jgi:hypothetical protein
MAFPLRTVKANSQKAFNDSEFLFKKGVLTESYCRNGFIKTKGVFLSVGGGTLSVYPINSKGVVANGWVGLHMDSGVLRKLARQFDDLAGDLERKGQ